MLLVERKFCSCYSAIIHLYILMFFFIYFFIPKYVVSFLCCRYRTLQQRVAVDDNYKMAFILKVSVEPLATMYLSIVKRRSGDRHQTYFLVVYEKMLDIAGVRLNDNALMKYYYDNNMVNVVTIFLRDDGRFYISTYWPFEHKVIYFPLSTYLQAELYPDKVKNFKGSMLRVSLFEEEVRAGFKPSANVGADASMAKLLAKKLNATLVIRKPADNLSYGAPTNKSDRATGSLGQVAREEVDIALNSRLLRIDLYINDSFAEPTINLGRDDLCVLIPKATTNPMIINLYQSLDSTVWVLLLLVIFPFAAIFHYIATSARLGNDPYRRPILLDLLRSSFNQTVTHLPRKMYLRFLVIFWIIYCFFMTNILQSCLTSSLTVKSYGNDINSIADLSTSSYKVIGGIQLAPLVSTYFYDSKESYQKRITNEILTVSREKYNQLLGNNSVEYAYLNKCHLTKYFAQFKIVNGQPMYNAMKESLIPFLACYIVPFGSPFLGRFNDIIAWTEQAGLFTYWNGLMIERPKRNGQQNVNNVQGMHSALTMDQLNLFFLFWIGGLAISTCVFLGEIFLYRKPKVA